MYDLYDYFQPSIFVERINELIYDWKKKKKDFKNEHLEDYILDQQPIIISILNAMLILIHHSNLNFETRMQW